MIGSGEWLFVLNENMYISIDFVLVVVREKHKKVCHRCEKKKKEKRKADREGKRKYQKIKKKPKKT